MNHPLKSTPARLPPRALLLARGALTTIGDTPLTHRTRASPRPHTALRARIQNMPLAIEINALERILAILDDRAYGVMLTPEAAEAWRAANTYGAARNIAPSARGKSAAIIGLYGPMMSQAEALQAISGATSTREFASLVRRAADDPNVNEIILDIDSPGGSVTSIDTAGEAVRYAATRKPVTAVTEGMMASAAYWVGSQATRVVASANAMVGSISVITSHMDASGWYEAEGLNPTILATGAKKAVGNDTGPLDDAARAELMRVAQAYHDQFVAAVAQGRGITPDRVQAEWADGRVETGTVARQIGMVDEIGTIADVLNDITGPPKQKGASAVKLSDVAAVLRNAPRLGAEQDDPEGARTIELSDTLASQMADSIETEQAERAKASKAAQTEARRALATTALQQAALTPVSSESDTAFRTAVEQAAINAADDTAASAAVAALIEDRAAILTAAKGDNHPNLPTPSEASAAREAEAELRRIRRTTRLPN